MRSILTALLVFSLGFATLAGMPDQDKRTAAQILDAMFQTYQNCKTYSDTGTVKTTFITSGGIRSERRPFKTAFVRPDKFRFEFTENTPNGEHPTRYIVWRDGNKVKTWWDIGSRIEDEPSLPMAIAGATGISGGSAHTIPALLMPSEDMGYTLRQVTSLVRLTDSSCGNSKCFVVRGKNSQGDFLTLWVDSTTMLLQQIHSGHNFAYFQSENITTYTPAIDGQILDSMLAFSAPIQK